MVKRFTYNAEDIFQDIEGDNENVLMNVPLEIVQEMEWKPGDVLRIKIEETGGISIVKVENE